MAHVYLLHFTPALHHARHYCGHTPNGVAARVDMHRKGTGAKLTRAASLAGSTLHVAKTWHFDTTHEARLFERALKNSHRLPDYCPMCKKAHTRQPQPVVISKYYYDFDTQSLQETKSRHAGILEVQV